MLDPMSDTGRPPAAASITRNWPLSVRCSKSPAARSGTATLAPDRATFDHADNALLVVTYWPDLSLYLPRLMGYVQ